MVKYKVTYHSDAGNVSFYLNAEFIEVCNWDTANLENEFNKVSRRVKYLPAYEHCRVYWIDNGGDEIQMVFDEDFRYFMQNNELPHMHIEAINKATKEEPKTHAKQSSSAEESAKPDVQDQSIQYVTHRNVQCNNCLAAPIIGFRYNCLQCNDYDLCQICEGKHAHSEHLMVRIPNTDKYNAECLYLHFGRRHGRKHSKHARVGKPSHGMCSGGTTAKLANASDAFDGGKTHKQHSYRKERCGTNERKHHRANSLWSNMCAIMRDLAEAGNADCTSSGSPIANSPEKIIQGATSAAAMANAAAKKAAKAAQLLQNIDKVVVNEATDQKTNSSIEKDKPHDVEGMHGDGKENIEKQSSNETKQKANANDFCEANTSTKTIPTAGLQLDVLSQIFDPQLLRAGMQILSSFGEVFNEHVVDTTEINDDNNSDTESSASSSKCSSFNQNEKVNADAVKGNNNSQDNATHVAAPKESSHATNDNNPDNIKSTPSNNNIGNVVEIRDLSEDSDSDCSSDSFIKINVGSTKSSTNGNDDNNSLDCEITPINLPLKGNSNLPEFTQKQNENSTKLTTNNSTSTQDLENGIDGSVKDGSQTTSTTETQNMAVPVYHPDSVVNDRVRSMIEMGFSNHDNSLIRLMEVVGSIPEALDIILASQNNAD